MKVRSFYISTLILLLVSAVSISGQEGESKQGPVRISKGVVNGMAISLPKPVYPAAALAVNASGAVTVSVVIGIDGNVIAANAVSGHPLLRQASVDAALQSKFQPTLLVGGQAVEVSGVIVYNFSTGRKILDFLKLGFALEYIRLTSREPQNELLYELAGSVPDEWTAESGQVRGLLRYFQVSDLSDSQKETSANDTGGEENRNIIVRKFTSAGNTRAYVVKNDADIVNVTDPAETAQQLDSAIKSRLTGGSANSWRYETGKAIGEVLSNLNDPSLLGGSIAQIKIQKDSAPSSLPAAFPSILEKIIRLYENPQIDEKKKLESIAAECLLLGT